MAETTTIIQDGLQETDQEMRHEELVFPHPAKQAHYEALERATFWTVRKAVRWLLQFTQTDVLKLSEEKLMKLQYRVHQFSQVGVLESRGHLPLGTTTFPWNWKGTPGKATIVPDLSPEEEIKRRLPSIETLQALQRAIAEDVKAFIETKQIDHPRPSGQITLMYDKKRDRMVEFFRPDHGGGDTPQNAFRYRSTRLIYGLGSRLRKCPDCQEIFVANRRDQRHCSRQCQRRTAMRRLRKTPPDRIGKRGRPPKSNAKGRT